MIRSKAITATAFTIVEICIVISIIGILLALFLPAIMQARAASLAAHCRENLRQVGIALADYHGTHRIFPPAKINPGSYRPIVDHRSFPILGGGTKNTTGWVLLLPFLEQHQLFAEARE